MLFSKLTLLYNFEFKNSLKFTFIPSAWIKHDWLPNFPSWIRDFVNISLSMTQYLRNIEHWKGGSFYKKHEEGAEELNYSSQNWSKLRISKFQIQTQNDLIKTTMLDKPTQCLKIPCLTYFQFRIIIKISWCQISLMKLFSFLMFS